MPVDLKAVVKVFTACMTICLLYGTEPLRAEETPSQKTPSKQSQIVRLFADPAQLILEGPEATWTVLIQGETTEGELVDLTQEAAFNVADSSLVTIPSPGSVVAQQDGKTEITITTRDLTTTVPVLVKNSQTSRQIHFENDVLPILSKFSCNGSGCHGKAEGQNGFKLSVFGFDPEADYHAIAMESRGRRVFPSAPEESLFLQKATGGVPHGGGIPFKQDSYEYRLLKEWIASGLPKGASDAPVVQSIQITPSERKLGTKAHQQLRVTATYTDGREVDVTRHAQFYSNNDALGSVDSKGLVTTMETPGEVAIMASYHGAVNIFRAIIPRPGAKRKQPDLPTYNFIDEFVQSKLEKLNIVSSGLCEDAEYLRRVTLDLTGTLPTAQETRQFLSDSHPEKRARLVENLLQREQFVDYWTLKWADLLRVDRTILGRKQAYAYYSWIRRSFAENKPFDQFVKELVNASGMLHQTPEANFYKVVTEPGKRASTLSQVFLGVRIDCAQCHHHPFDRWTQTDYYGMQAFFTQASFKEASGGEMMGALSDTPSMHPRSGEPIYAHVLGTENPNQSIAGDRRLKLSEWMTSKGNPWLARAFVNRIWAHMMGRGLVEPVDDFRMTNPATNPELLETLSQHFIESGFDFQELLKTIAASRTYQLSSQPNETNELDEQNYSRALLKTMDAEVLYDAVSQVTGTTEKFAGAPAGTRAVQLWDSEINHYFLKLFGRPSRVTACECERNAEPSVSQVLHVLNSPEIHQKLTHAGGWLRKLQQQFPGAEQNAKLVEEIYLTIYSRPPTERELKVALEFLNVPDKQRAQAMEDIVWSLMNTVEFLFNH